MPVTRGYMRALYPLLYGQKMRTSPELISTNKIKAYKRHGTGHPGVLHHTLQTFLEPRPPAPIDFLSAKWTYKVFEGIFGAI